ncbi:hypothetical protein [Ichthyenterobacterium magnum]|uniref:Uncharacterized protein n=1 Tax=Ichthyenterobacterium magnum TaxID=1230530 RepID=A0A420DM28_9FLAO|nr:hypothetical protein [Ichthyenterobacterium magnum]RKE95261.1 hypothetical protein BXY80_1447 [Ichthyenterobacterium magnum]
MKHSFRFKKNFFKTAFSNKVGIKSLSIKSNNDLKNVVNTLLMYIELENHLQPVNCSYSFFETEFSFELELNENKEKKDFFDSIKKFENFLEL